MASITAKPFLPAIGCSIADDDQNPQTITPYGTKPQSYSPTLITLLTTTNHISGSRYHQKLNTRNSTRKNTEPMGETTDPTPSNPRTRTHKNVSHGMQPSSELGGYERDDERGASSKEQKQQETKEAIPDEDLTSSFLGVSRSLSCRGNRSSRKEICCCGRREREETQHHRKTS